MAVKIRLKRFGKIRTPQYRVVIADSRTKRDGRVIEEIGFYRPTEDPSFIEIQSERAQYWLSVGAQPSEQVLVLLKLTGDWGIFKGDPNAQNTVKVKEAKVPFVLDEKKKPVLSPKSEKSVKKEETPADESSKKSTSDEKSTEADAPVAQLSDTTQAETAGADAPAADAE